jgi:hypothetical protein
VRGGGDGDIQLIDEMLSMMPANNAASNPTFNCHSQRPLSVAAAAAGGAVDMQAGIMAFLSPHYQGQCQGQAR